MSPLPETQDSSMPGMTVQAPFKGSQAQGVLQSRGVVIQGLAWVPKAPVQVPFRGHTPRGLLQSPGVVFWGRQEIHRSGPGMNWNESVGSCRATGHGSYESLVRSLEARKTSPQVMQLAPQGGSLTLRLVLREERSCRWMLLGGPLQVVRASVSL